MAIVAFVVDAIPSHIYSSVGLARRLKRRGFQIEYWGIARNGIDALVESQGFRFVQLPGLRSRYQEDIRLPTDLSILNVWRRAGEIAPKVTARRERWKTLRQDIDKVEASLDACLQASVPAFVVLDPFLLAYYPLLKCRGVATVVLSTKPLPIRDPAVPPYDSELVPTTSKFNRLCIALAWMRCLAQDLAYRTLRTVAHLVRVYTYHDILEETARRTGFNVRDELVRRWIQPDLHFRSLDEWALWTPGIDFPRTRPVPDNVRYVGPSVDLERQQAMRPATGPSARIVYVAVGTVRFRWKDNLPFLRKAIAALADLPDMLVYISTGDERATEALGAPPANIHIFDFLPQLQMLDVASLVITHAGAGTYRECIEKCVPMLAYPRNHDQLGNSARIVFHEIGLRGNRRLDSVEDIRRKALRVLSNPVCIRNLERLREDVHAHEGELLATALDRVLADTGIPVHAGVDVA
jgi:zeaxanthin glucosyltransferase